MCYPVFNKRIHIFCIYMHFLLMASNKTILQIKKNDQLANQFPLLFSFSLGRG